MENEQHDRVPSNIPSLQDAKTKEEAITLMRKFIEEGVNSGPSIAGPAAFKRLIDKLADKHTGTVSSDDK